MNKLLLIAFFFLSIIQVSFSQDSTKLNIGDKAPNIVLPTSDNTVQSFTFPYNNKITFLYFWSSSVAKSKGMLYKLNKLQSRYSNIDYKNAEGFEIISIALQSDRTVWGQDLIKHNLMKVNNCIALKGYKDYFIKPYKLEQTPSSFIIDQNGKIAYINPNLTQLITYLDERKNTLSDEQSARISGKILVGQNTRPLKGEKVYILNEKKDTIQTLITNIDGGFYAKGLPDAQTLNINIGLSDQIEEGETISLATDNGEIIGDFEQTKKGFEYRLLEVERMFLKPMKEEKIEMKMTTELKDLYYKENLFKSGGSDLSADAKLKLNGIIDKLKVNNKTRVEITTHTDCKGDAELNRKLSLIRAQSISKYFVSKGILAHRIKTIGKGESEPVNSCIDDVPCSDKELEVNRRTEFNFFISE